MPQFFGLLRPKSGNAARGGADLYETAAPGWERGTLGSYRSALGLRWDGSAGYWIRRGVGRPARSRRAQCWTADRVCTAFSLRNDPPEESRSPRVARARGELGDGVSFKPSVEESEQPASTSRHASFGERFLFDLASFDERFAGGDISVAETEDSDSKVVNYADLPSPGLGEHASQSVTGRSTPKLAPTALSPPASSAKKRVATAEASKHSISPADDDSRTAIYDIAARTVYLPNGRRLEAHSGLGSHMDDARYVHLKQLGPTPPNSYKLVMREEPFHGVRAIRLVPVGDGDMFGRDGLLAHSYMLGPNGQSNGCVSFSDYPAFLDAYLRGEVDRLMVVEHLATAPGPKTASGWVPEFIKDLFRRS